MYLLLEAKNTNNSTLNFIHPLNPRSSSDI